MASTAPACIPRRVLLLLAVALPSSLAAQPPLARLDHAQATEAVAANLTADGRFVLPPTVVNPPGQLGESQAKVIATRYVLAFAPLPRGTPTTGHGAAIVPATLAPCDRALYAASPYASLNGPALSEVTVRTFGPYWVVPMCDAAGRLQLVVSFSALATEMGDNLSSPTQPLPWERSYVSSHAVPPDAAAAMYSPEGAARYAFAATGKRVNSVPELIMAPMPRSPVLVRWRVNLEAPITVTGAHSGVSRQRDALLVGFGDTFRSSGLLDADPQAQAPLSWTDAVTKAQFTVVLAPNVPGAVELVTPTNP